MEAFVGRWKVIEADLDKCYEFEVSKGYKNKEFLETSKEFYDPEAGAMSEYSIEGDKIKETLYFDGKVAYSEEFELGKEREATDPEKRVSKLTATLEGNKLITRQIFTDGDYSAEYIQEVQGDTLLETMTSKRLEVKRKLVKV